jgi:hypothetical protein
MKEVLNLSPMIRATLTPPVVQLGFNHQATYIRAYRVRRGCHQSHEELVERGYAAYVRAWEDQQSAFEKHTQCVISSFRRLHNLEGVFISGDAGECPGRQQWICNTCLYREWTIVEWQYPQTLLRVSWIRGLPDSVAYSGPDLHVLGSAETKYVEAKPS